MPLLRGKRKASQQSAPFPVSARGDGFDVESTFRPDEGRDAEPLRKKQRGSASDGPLSKSAKVSSKSKQVTKNKPAPNKSTQSKSELSGKDSNSRVALPESRSRQDVPSQRSGPREDAVQTSNMISSSMEEVPGVAQHVQSGPAISAEIAFSGTTIDGQDQHRESSTARRSRVQSSPRAPIAEMRQLPLPAQRDAVGTTDSDSRAKVKTFSTQVKPSKQMGIEYQQLPRVDRTMFCGHGLLWNQVLMGREVLLAERIAIEAKQNGKQCSVIQCPLSSRGREAMKFFKLSNQSLMVTKLMDYKLQLYTDLPDAERELVSADLYHLMIPRLIRHIHHLCALPSIKDDDDASLRSAMGLLEILSDLCDTARRMVSDLEIAVLEALEKVKRAADQISTELEESVLELETIRQRRREQEEQEQEEIKQRQQEAQELQDAIRRDEREKRYRALLESKYAANKQRSETYWSQRLSDREAILGEIYSTDDLDGRLWRRRVTGRTPSFKSFTWTQELTDILTNELIKYQDHDAEYRYEQCLKCEPLSFLTLGEIRRRALEIKPFLEEEWLKMTGSIPRYVWTIR